MTAWFARLALLACCTGYVLGLILIGRWLGGGWAVAVMVAGTVLALVVTLELEADAPPQPRARFLRFGEPRTRPYDGVE